MRLLLAFLAGTDTDTGLPVYVALPLAVVAAGLIIAAGTVFGLMVVPA